MNRHLWLISRESRIKISYFQETDVGLKENDKFVVEGVTILIQLTSALGLFAGTHYHTKDLGHYGVHQHIKPTMSY